MELVDTHCHLGHIDDDPANVVAEAQEAGVGLLVDIGMGTDESRAAVERAERSDGRVKAAVGLHPNDLSEYRDDASGAIDRMRGLAASGVVVAIGETGMDTYRDREPVEVQEAAFRDHIALAKELGKALVIHTRDTYAEVLRVLDDAGAPDRVVMHCFSGDAAYARACAERAFFCSFAGNLTYARNDGLREAAAVLPEGLLLVETDAPFLAPLPNRGKPNRPAWVRHTAEVLAGVRGSDPSVLAEQLSANARRAFAIG